MRIILLYKTFSVIPSVLNKLLLTSMQFVNPATAKTADFFPPHFENIAKLVSFLSTLFIYPPQEFSDSQTESLFLRLNIGSEKCLSENKFLLIVAGKQLYSLLPSRLLDSLHAVHEILNFVLIKSSSFNCCTSTKILDFIIGFEFK